MQVRILPGKAALGSAVDSGEDVLAGAGEYEVRKPVAETMLAEGVAELVGADG